MSSKEIDKKTDTIQDFHRRFSSVARLYGESGLQRFSNSQITVIGIGGVGSWVVEALARSAIGKIILIDMDVVSESNINRQLPALSSTLGRNKIDVMKQRILDINQNCEVVTIDDFASKENIQAIIPAESDYVIDCIDNSRVKAAIIAWCRLNKIPIITVGGAGGQTDPQKIKIADLSQSIHDPLLSKTRKILRKEYGFSSNTKRRFSVPCVFSTEHLILPANTQHSAGLSCAGGIGSCVTVTASFGFIAASNVLKKLVK